MLNSDKSLVQGYNAQAVVDADSKVIVAADLTNKRSDVQHLEGLVAQVERNTGRRPKKLSADAGYWSEANVRVLEGRGIEVFIPPEKVKHSEWRIQRSPRGRIPSGLSVKDLMRRKLRTKRGRERYKLRQTSVEPAFGTIKEPLGLRQFLLRGSTIGVADGVRSVQHPQDVPGESKVGGELEPEESAGTATERDFV